MKKTLLTTLLMTSTVAIAADYDHAPVGNVTWENYHQAESDWNFLGLQEKVGVNEWLHAEAVSPEAQTVIRSNRDVMYSTMIVDVSEGATFHVPAENNDYFQIIHIMDENHLVHAVVRRGETLTLTADDLTTGTHVHVLARTRIAESIEDTKRRQSLLSIKANSSKPYQGKGFDADDVVGYRLKLINNVMKHGAPIEGLKGFGATLEDVEDHHFKYVTAFGYAGLPATTAQYLERVPGQGETMCQEWTIPTPNLDVEGRGGYFSLTTYGADGWIDSERFYTSGESMRDNGDGTVSMTFNCGSGEVYDFEVSEGWAGVLRLYEPVNVQETLDYMETLRGIQIKPL
ncbi:DUF1254 domain-containing protein [Vibrio agarivorans]|nr:DUF1254 domain-containing protein [Vibrio agarivorans]MDN3663447.1 DUF1254 domain-containing protein [Vibrio agarivorans]